MAEERIADLIPPEPQQVAVGPFTVPLRRLTLSDWAAIEGQFGSLDAFLDAFNGKGIVQAALFVLYRLIKKSDPSVTLSGVGDSIDDIGRAMELVGQVLHLSVPQNWREDTDVPKDLGAGEREVGIR